jgi:hypothetical protein
MTTGENPPPHASFPPGEAYDPDDVGLRDSPLLKPMRPNLQPSPSPPPAVPLQVNPESSPDRKGSNRPKNEPIVLDGNITSQPKSTPQPGTQGGQGGQGEASSGTSRSVSAAQIAQMMSSAFNTFAEERPQSELYAHHRLPDSRDIRLLKVWSLEYVCGQLPDGMEDEDIPLVATMYSGSLSDLDSKYAALSYVWGPDKKPRNIFTFARRLGRG